MLCGVKMLRGMLILGGVAAAYVAAEHAQTEVDPVVSDLQTVFTTVGARLHVVNRFHMMALGH
jgi:hypothetical protein